MTSKEEIKKYLAVIKRAVAIIESKLEDDGGLLEQLTQEAAPVVAVQRIELPEPPVVPGLVVPLEQIMARKKHIDDLMAIDCWPEAVPSFQATAAVTDESEISRANMVLDHMIDRSTEGVSFLDFGCGDGWRVQQALSRGVKEAIGYDPRLNKNWPQREGVFTHQLGELRPGGYDIIMLYDFLDHSEEPMEVMDTVRRLLKSNGSVYIRCHPWTSRHAMHLHKSGLNKAYIHLFMSYTELSERSNCTPMFTRVEKDPLNAYRWWFRNFQIVKERCVKDAVNPFFQVQAFKELLAVEQEIDLSQIDKFLATMEIQFVDYVLKAH